jgi:mono/diheme cytochrome c family protein
MRTRKLVASAAVLALPMVLLGCPDQAETPPPPTTQPTTQPGTPATTPAAPGAPGAAVTSARALPAGITQEMVQQGQQIYAGQGICFTCHGQAGAGSVLGPALNDGQWLWLEDPNNFEQLVGIIRTGVAQPREYPAPMPPMGGASLNDDQVRSVAAYVWALSPS